MGIKVFAPASISNLAVGFDILGVALEAPGDDIIIKRNDKKGLSISTIRSGKSLSSSIMENTAGYAAHKLLDHLGELDCGLEMEIHKNIPIGRGMGSSAASAVAGVMAVNEILGKPLEKRALLSFAAQGEYIASGAIHLDNVAPSLLGGITLIRDTPTMDIQRIHAPIGLVFLVICPNVKIYTKESRGKLSTVVPMDKFIQQTANIGGLIAGCYTSNFDLIQRSLIDHVIEEQRKDDIPLYDQMKTLALEHNALGFNISGSGSSMFALCKNSLDLENIRSAAMALYTDKKIEITCYASNINHEGAIKY